MNQRPRRSPSTDRLTKLVGRPQAKATRRHKPDYWLLVLTALMLLVGLVVVYSISPGLAASRHVSQSYFVGKQFIDVALAGVAFGAASLIPVSWWRKSARPLAAAALVGCLVVLVTPIDAVYQAHRWIRVGGLSFQVAELIKVALLVWTAGFLTDKWQKGQLSNFKATLKPLLVLMLAIGVLVAKTQSDLGSTGVMLAMIGLMAYLVGIPLRKVAIFGGLVIVLVVLAVSTSSYRRDRLATFLHPGRDCQGTSYQACQALISVGSGGVFGLGLGYSVQAYGYQPEASNDSIFAIMAEKFGFIGTISLLVLYGAFIAKLKNIIERTTDQFSRLLVVGVMAWLSTQMIINIGAMIGLLPLKGITLPLISQGGTSMIFITAALGLVFQVSRYTSYSKTEPENTYHETANPSNSFDGRRVGRAHNAAIVSRPRT